MILLARFVLISAESGDYAAIASVSDISKPKGTKGSQMTLYRHLRAFCVVNCTEIEQIARLSVVFSKMRKRLYFTEF